MIFELNVYLNKKSIKSMPLKEQKKAVEDYDNDWETASRWLASDASTKANREWSGV